MAVLKDKNEQIREQPNSQHDAKRRPAEAKDSQHNKVDCGRVPVRFGGQEYQSHNQHRKGKAGGKDGGKVHFYPAAAVIHRICCEQGKDEHRRHNDGSQHVNDAC